MTTRYKIRLDGRIWQVWMRKRRWWGTPELTLVGAWAHIADAATHRDRLTVRRRSLSSAIEWLSGRLP